MAQEQLQYATEREAVYPRTSVHIQLPDGREITGNRAELLDALAGTSADNAASRGELLSHQFGSDDPEFIRNLASDLKSSRMLIRPFGFDIKCTVSPGRAVDEEPGYYLTAPEDGNTLERRVDEYWPTGVRKKKGAWENLMTAARYTPDTVDPSKSNGHTSATNTNSKSFRRLYL